MLPLFEPCSKDYPIFIHWYQTLQWILDSVEKYPRKARFSIASRIADASLDILEEITDAIYQPKQRSKILSRINLKLEKLRVLYRLSHDRKYLSVRQYEHISKALDTTGKMVGGWQKKSHA